MASFLTILTDVPALISGLSTVYTLAQKVLPEAEADAQALWAQVLPKIEKLKTDFVAMTSGGLKLVTVVTDVPGLVSDVSDLLGGFGTILTNIETDAKNIWAEVTPAVTTVKGQLDDLLGSAPSS